MRETYYVHYQRTGTYSRLLVGLSVVSCLLAIWVVLAGLTEAQRFSVSQAHDLRANPGVFDPSRSFTRLGAYSPLEQILLYLDAVKLQVWIAVGMFSRICGLLIKTKLGLLIAQLGLLFSTAVMFKYLFWSLNLLSCDSCLQRHFLLSVPLGLSYPYVLLLLIVFAMEVGLFIGFAVARLRSQGRH
jgi:hypothetical protein